MAVYKDKNRGTWYASVLYVDWTGKRCRKLKRGFATKKEAQEWEIHFKLQKASSLDMTFGDFYKIYEQDIKPKVRYNTWCSKQHIIETKLLPYFKNLVMPDTVAKEMKDFLDSIYGLEQEDRIFPISKSYLHHEMDRGVKESGVKRIRIHDLRHSHVSLLIDMGFSAVAIGNRVGHESEKITYRYAHLFPSVQGEMAEALDDEWKEGFNVGKEEG